MTSKSLEIMRRFLSDLVEILSEALEIENWEFYKQILKDPEYTFKTIAEEYNWKKDNHYYSIGMNIHHFEDNMLNVLGLFGREKHIGMLGKHYLEQDKNELLNLELSSKGHYVIPSYFFQNNYVQHK